MTGGPVRPSPTGAVNDAGEQIEAIMLSRGTTVMSRASVEAMDPDLLRQVVGDNDLLIAEDALAMLDAGEDC